MRSHKILLLSLLLALALSTCYLILTTPSAKPEVNIILISWDGVQRNHLYELLNAGLLPNLELLISEGGIINLTVKGHATDTKAGHAQMLTGYPPEITGVYSNNKFNAIPPGLTIFERAKQFYNVKTIVITGKKGNLLQILLNALSSLDYYSIKKEDADSVGSKALKQLEKYGDCCFLAFIHFSDPDHAGHKYGENSAEYTNAIIECDEWLGKIIQKLKELGIYNKTIIYVTTDHGFDEGAKTHRNAPDIWLVTNDHLITTTGTQADIAPTILYRLGIDLNSLKPKLPGSPLVSREGEIDF